jgi:hypothetical protein
MMSGHKFNASLPFPCFGSVVAKERGYRDGMLPFVQLGKSIDRRFNGGIAGFLGDEFNPFEVPDDPSSPQFKVRDLAVGTDAERARLDRRYAMLADLENYQRMVEAGVQFVTVTDGGWDTHTNNFKSLKDRLLPRVDRGASALIDDLATRGLLDETLVVWFGDFGRTPKVNPTAGRDHWSTAGVAFMAGGGLKVGQVVGQTNALAEYVTDSPVSPQDIAATIYTVLGVPLHTWYKAQDGRPIELCPEGKPVKQLI